MRALVTGAGGWLGSALVKELLSKGYYVRALIYKKSDKLENLKKYYDKYLEIIKWDIREEESFEEKLEGIDAVYHLAAKVHFIPKNKSDEKEFFKVNTYGSEKLFKAAIRKQVKRFIFYSTVAVYGSLEECVDTTYPYKIETVYAESKAEAEKIAFKLFEEKNFPVTIIQPVTVYGGYDRGNFAKIKTLAEKVGLCIQFGDGNNKKAVIYYEDLIKETISIAENKAMIGKKIIAGTEVLTINNINEVLKNNVKKVRKIVINEDITKFILKILKNSKSRFTKKIYLSVLSLCRSNEYSTEEFRSLRKEYKSFKESYFG